MPPTTSNPFQFQGRSAHKPAKARPSKLLFVLATAGLAGVIVLAAWLLMSGRGLPNRLKMSALLPLGDGHVFTAQADLNREQARTLYRKALTDLDSGSNEDALAEFKRLEPVYPGLQDMLWLHEAEAYAALGNEWAVQKKLTDLIGSQPDSALQAVALYRVGQSQFRGSEWDKAEKTFTDLRARFPKSTYATGSLYYLGSLQARQSVSQPQAVTSLSSYLSECPDCKFSGEAADKLETILPKPTAEQHAWLGVAEAAAGKEPLKALHHLQLGTRSIAWLALGKAQLRAGQRAAGLQTLTTGLGYARELDESQSALGLLLSHTSGIESQRALLHQLTSRNLTTGGDFVLWKLAELDPTNAATTYRSLLNHYPNSDYAPESGWNLLWPLLNNGQRDAYLAQAQQYLSHYGYARSAPKALFWMAKLLENSNPAEATRAYERVLSQYPATYYAFRASGRLKVLAGGKPDPGWTTISSRSYPPSETDINTLDILPRDAAFGSNSTGANRRNAARELQAIGAPEDTRLFVTEATGSLPPAVDSWASQASGDRAQGLRTIRDALEKDFRDRFRAAEDPLSVPPAGTDDELKLLYPVYFPDPISNASRQNHLDPFLVQALMREESYFNEFAISGSNARGLMQLMPATAQDVANWEHLPGFRTADLFLPAVNIRLGSRYLGFLHQQFNGNSMPAVGAYNGGPGAMKRWVQNSPDMASDPDLFVERIPYEQSRDYIKKVFGSWWNYQRLYDPTHR